MSRTCGAAVSESRELSRSAPPFCHATTLSQQSIPPVERPAERASSLLLMAASARCGALLRPMGVHLPLVVPARTGGIWFPHRASSFFFQAEDGIRDYKVTGVQTCALPI